MRAVSYTHLAHSTGAASKLLDMVKAGEKNYTFIEVMGCPGGCVNGGGQPIVSPAEREIHDPRVLRAKALYDEDEAKMCIRDRFGELLRNLSAPAAR